MTPPRIWAIASAWALFSISLWASDAEPAVAVLAGLIAAIAAGGFIAYDLVRVVLGVRWTRSRAQHLLDVRGLKDRRPMNIGVRYDSPELHGTLMMLVDDRLIAHHGIDRAVAPEAAASVLTPRLQRLIEGPRRGIAAPRELQRILSDIEEL